MEKDKSLKKFTRFEINRKKILDFLLLDIERNARFGQNEYPNITTIAKATGLSRVTIHKHLKKMNEFEDVSLNAYKVLIPKLFNSLYDIAISSSNEYARIKATKTLLMFLLEPRNVTNISGQNNYIQMNIENESKELP
ncbi:MAG: hypothetical protein N2558_04915 [Patescibacteria group bacterium]|nr:hypothetical protein [Patescibacteria group bacterium]